MLNKGTASLEVKNSERNRELENFASLEPRVCEGLLYCEMTAGIGATVFEHTDGQTEGRANIKVEIVIQNRIKPFLFRLFDPYFCSF